MFIELNSLDINVSTSSEVEAGETAIMHEKPDPTPLGWPILPRHNQPFTPPIPSKHQAMRYTTNPSDYNF
jgi:hypothetical protein